MKPTSAKSVAGALGYQALNAALNDSTEMPHSC